MSEIKDDKPIVFDRCLRCGRKLKTEEARKLGYGKVCAQKACYVRIIRLLDFTGGEWKINHK